MTTENREVAPGLKERFSEWIDQRTAIGTDKYGEPLMVHNKRNPRRDMTEELLDFAQYQEQDRQRLIEDNARLRVECGELLDLKAQMLATLESVLKDIDETGFYDCASHEVMVLLKATIKAAKGK